MATMYEMLYAKLCSGEKLEVSGIAITTLRPRLSEVHAAVKREAEAAGIELPPRRVQIQRGTNTEGEEVLYVQLAAGRQAKMQWKVVAQDEAEGLASTLERMP